MLRKYYSEEEKRKYLEEYPKPTKRQKTFVSEKIKIELVQGFNKEFLMKIVEVMCYAE